MPVPISEARNLGPVCAPELRAAGFETVESMVEAGWEEVCLQWAGLFPARINVNAFAAVIGAIDGVDWRAIDPAKKERARRLASRLRARQRGKASG